MRREIAMKKNDKKFLSLFLVEFYSSNLQALKF